MLCDRCLKEFEKEDPASKVVYDDDGLLFEFCSKKRANLYTLESFTDLVRGLKIEDLDGQELESLKALARSLNYVLEGKFDFSDKEVDEGR